MAAGKGTRLKSKHPKVLHEVGGKPLLAHVIAAALSVVPAKDVYAIIGHEADRVRTALAGSGINFVLQKEQRGTGHALIVAREALNPMTTFSCYPETHRSSRRKPSKVCAISTYRKKLP